MMKKNIFLLIFFFFMTTYADEPCSMFGLDKINSDAYIESALNLSRMHVWSISSVPLKSKIRSDKSTALKFMAVNGNGYKYLMSSLQDDKDVFLTAIKTSYIPYKYVNKLKLNKDFVLEILKSANYFEVNNFPDKYKSDKEIALGAVKSSKRNFLYVDKKFRSDKDFALALHGDFYSLYDEKLKNDPEIIDILLGIPGYLVELPNKVIDKKEYQLKAIKRYRGNIDTLSKKYIFDSKFTPYVIEQCDLFDENVIKKLIKKAKKENIKIPSYCGKYFKYLDEEDRDNPQIALSALANVYSPHPDQVFTYISDRLKNDDTFIKLALKTNGDVYKYLDFDDLEKKELALLALKNNGIALRYFLEKFRNDKGIVLTAIKTNPNAIQFSDLMDNKEFILTTLGIHPGVFKFVSDKLKNDKNIVMSTVKRDGFALEFASAKLRDDEEIVSTAIKTHTRAFKYASKRLKTNKKIFKQYIDKARQELISPVTRKELKEYFKVDMDKCDYSENIFNRMLPVLWM